MSELVMRAREKVRLRDEAKKKDRLQAVAWVLGLLLPLFLNFYCARAFKYSLASWTEFLFFPLGLAALVFSFFASTLLVRRIQGEKAEVIWLASDFDTIELLLWFPLGTFILSLGLMSCYPYFINRWSSEHLEDLRLPISGADGSYVVQDGPTISMDQTMHVGRDVTVRYKDHSFTFFQPKGESLNFIKLTARRGWLGWEYLIEND